MTITEQEVREMFPPDGVNWEDYWLGTVPGRSLQATTGWRGVPDVLADMRAEEIGRWTPDDDATEALMDYNTAVGGGLKGDTPELRRVREGLIAYGQQSVDFRRRVAALKR